MRVRLRDAGWPAIATREPGGTEVGDAVRAIFLDPQLSLEPLTEALLMNAARIEHVARTIAPSLEAGTTVVTDRFVDSTLAYQGYGRGLDLTYLRDLCARAIRGVTLDVTLVVDVPLSVSRERTSARDRSPDRVESEDDAFHQRVRAGYLELARAQAHCLLDGTLPPGELAERAFRAIEPLMAARLAL